MTNITEKQKLERNKFSIHKNQMESSLRFEES